MATEEAESSGASVTVLPGDIVQDSAGMIYLVSETHRWGVGAVMRWLDQGQTLEAYFRLKPEQFAVVGTAALLPTEIAERRNEAERHAAEIKSEAKA